MIDINLLIQEMRVKMIAMNAKFPPRALYNSKTHPSKLIVYISK